MVKLHQQLLVYSALGSEVLFQFKKERLLITWLEDCNQKWIPIGTNNIIVRPFSLFLSLKEKKFEGIPQYFLPADGGLKSLKLELQCIISSYQRKQ
jgi:hypothetical protein